MAETTSFKRKRGRPPVGSTLVGVSFPPEQIAALDRWILNQNETGLSRPEAVRRIVSIVVRTSEEKPKVHE